MNEALAAPKSGLPALLTALASHPDAEPILPLASASHFFMKDVLAAPDKGLPALLTALEAQSESAADAACAKDMPAANTALRMQVISLDIRFLLVISKNGGQPSFPLRSRRLQIHSPPQ